MDGALYLLLALAPDSPPRGDSPVMQWAGSLLRELAAPGGAHLPNEGLVTLQQFRRYFEADRMDLGVIRRAEAQLRLLAKGEPLVSLWDAAVDEVVTAAAIGKPAALLPYFDGLRQWLRVGCLAPRATAEVHFRQTSKSHA